MCPRPRSRGFPVRLQSPEVEHSSGCVPDGVAGDAVPSFDCDRDEELPADPWTVVSSTLQLALLYKGKTQNVSQDPNAYRDMSSLQWRDQGLRRASWCHESAWRQSQRCVDGYPSGPSLEVQESQAPGECAVDQDSRSDCRNDDPSGRS